MTERVLNQKELAEFVGVNRKTLWRWHREGNLPEPIFIHRLCKYWSESQAEQLKQMRVGQFSVPRGGAKS